ncbi:epithelial cell-transforming sequence 2 oncogene-like isoform X2 [Tiliqua scincoides]|uniref:epithelial cell-transforming sequence 2 oncogene-like isoform X2 n=1 Tax=Tiliqua scincoides TaxID=71010 RepID=UPI003462AEF6
MTAAPIVHAPHHVKQWHLENLGFLGRGTVNPSQNPTTEILQTRFSSWTPIENKSLNKQLFQERVRLISHWFDLWTDKQRNQFLHWMLKKCNKSQLKLFETWFAENIPVTKVDFTTLLPRFLSLYIFCFLNPKDLCASAQVNWHWKFLTEQDCLWMPKCIRFGWFLPYTPTQNEYSAWKQHYIACAIGLGYLTPREVTEMYGILNKSKSESEEEEEQKEKYLQRIIRERLALHKKQLFKTRPPWVSGTKISGFFRSQPKLSQTNCDKAELPAALWLMKKRMSSSNYSFSNQFSDEFKSVPSVTLTTEKQHEFTSKTLLKRKNVAGCSLYPASPHHHCCTVFQRYTNQAQPLQPHLVLISSHVPAFEMIVDSVKPEVVPVVYEYSGTTLEGLLYYVEKALDGRTAKSIGIVSGGDSRGIDLLQGYRIGTKTLLKPEVREFWEKLGSFVISLEEQGHVDIFVSLAASEAGMEVLSQLSHLTGVFFRTPTGIATGAYQHILSEWLGNQNDRPPSIYFTEVKLQIWLRWTEVLEDALQAVRKNLRPYLCDLRKNVTGKIIGQIVFDTMSWCEVQDNCELVQALAEGLAELSRGHCENSMEFLSDFLMKKNSTNEEGRSQVFLTENNPEASFASVSVKSGTLQEGMPDKRTGFARELLLSEKNYVHTLEIVRDIYVKPLKAAVASNRAILSCPSIQTIFSDILDILQLNRWFLDTLTKRLNEWSPAQNLGDVFIKFGQQLQRYTNFFNNYSVILKTIDKCRETIPPFRAFLKRQDKTVVTNMKSLQELLLCPSKRFEEYKTLLYALQCHTPPEHTDHKDLTTAIKQIKQYKDYIDQLKQNADRDDQLLTTQRIIQGCPQLLKANRYLMRAQDVAQLRVYEHIHDLSLFLFNDILVVSKRSIAYKPFERTPKATHQFLTVIPLPRLIVEDILDSKYIKNAFLLQGPRCQLICTTVEEDKFIWLSMLQRAISYSIEENVNYL